MGPRVFAKPSQRYTFKRTIAANGFVSVTMGPVTFHTCDKCEVNQVRLKGLNHKKNCDQLAMQKAMERE